MKEVIAIIPARGGSKGVPGKNIRMIAGKPLIAWSIEAALASKLISRVIVSTDSAAYAKIAKQYGAEIPFLRPAEYSGDQSTDLEVFQHALSWLEEHEGYSPDVCVHLRPTYPLRFAGEIDNCIELLRQHPRAQSVRSITRSPDTPFKMWFKDVDGWLHPVVGIDGVNDPWNQPRQSLPKTFIQSASIDVVRTEVICDLHSMTGMRILGYEHDGFFDIDDEDDMEKAERALLAVQQREQPCQDKQDRKTYCFDIDGVIATLVPNNDYALAHPRVAVINRINSLYDEGHKIILFTARGSATGLSWENVTEKQMEDWGVKYHKLQFGKPAADYYVDDRMVPLSEFEKNDSEKQKE